MIAMPKLLVHLKFGHCVTPSLDLPKLLIALIKIFTSDFRWFPSFRSHSRQSVKHAGDIVAWPNGDAVICAPDAICALRGFAPEGVGDLDHRFTLAVTPAPPTVPAVVVATTANDPEPPGVYAV